MRPPYVVQRHRDITQRLRRLALPLQQLPTHPQGFFVAFARRIPFAQGLVRPPYVVQRHRHVAQRLRSLVLSENLTCKFQNLSIYLFAFFPSACSFQGLRESSSDQQAAALNGFTNPQPVLA